MLTAASSLTELISGFLKEDLINLFKPSALVAASIFFVLNWLLIFPTLIRLHVGPVIALYSLPTVWLVVVSFIVITITGYLINSLGSIFLGLVSGNAFKDSLVVGNLLLKLENRSYDNLYKQGNENAKYTLATEFPSRSEDLAPTHFGNVLANASSYTWNQYGVHLNTIWPIMDLTLQEKDERLSKLIADNRDALIFLSSIIVLLIVVAFEFVLTRIAGRRPYISLWALAILLLDYAVYKAAVQKALAWNRDVRTAFDLYLDDVAKKFGLRELPKHAFSRRKQRWQDISLWLNYYTASTEPDKASTEPDKAWYLDLQTNYQNQL